MTIEDLRGGLEHISTIIDENKDYLVRLDQQNGDGDLGITMSSGFRAAAQYAGTLKDPDIGKGLMQIASVFNESAPSSLGTIISFALMGMAKSLKVQTEATLNDFSAALEQGIENIKKKANSQPGEKTILDALVPGAQALREGSGEDCEKVFLLAAQEAKKGSDATKNMRAVHGRAAYYGEKSIGVLDGGSVVGSIIFEGIYRYCKTKGSESENGQQT